MADPEFDPGGGVSPQPIIFAMKTKNLDPGIPPWSRHQWINCYFNEKWCGKHYLDLFTARNIFTSVCQEFCPGGGWGGCIPAFLWVITPPGRHPPPSPSTYGIQSTSGRYTSYWNILLHPDQ